MVTDNGKIKCDKCGKFTSIKNIAYTHFIPDSDVSIEEFTQYCIDCYVPEKPKQPLNRIIADGDGKFCEFCGSGMVRKWFKNVGCRQSECVNYYKR